MSSTRFLELIETQNLYFSAATQFNDPFEGAIKIEPVECATLRRAPPPSSLDSAFERLKVLAKISCWHIEDHESDAMWRLYSELGKGVAITSSPRKLLSSLEDYRIKPEYGTERLWSGMVTYADLTREKINTGMLERFFFKHIAFSWEKEYRLLISLRLAEEFAVSVPVAGIHVSANTDSLISEIYLGPELSTVEREEIIRACERHNLQGRIRVSSLLSRPRYA